MSGLPTFIAHADWGLDAKKRWRTVASLEADGRYHADSSDLVASRGSPWERMGVPSGYSGTAVLGFDFPIGVPRRYAELAGISNFRAAIMEFGEGSCGGHCVVRTLYSVPSTE